MQEVSVGSPGAGPYALAAGPDGGLWFTLNQANAIGRIDTSGSITVRDVPTAQAGPVGIAATHDGSGCRRPRVGLGRVRRR